MKHKIFFVGILTSIFFVSLFHFNQIPQTQATSIKDTFYSSADDGTLYHTNSSYPTARNNTNGWINDSSTLINIGQDKLLTLYTITRGCIFFDTSTIGSLTITSATLSLYGSDDFSEQDFNITVQNGQPTYPHLPLVAGDYDRTHYSGNGGELNTSSFVVGAWNDIEITELGWINKTGTTKFILRSNREISGDAVPGIYVEDVNIYSGDSAYAPQLIVTYAYTFYGLYDEDTGLLKDASERAINVTAYSTENTTFTFELNGTYVYEPSEQPTLFKFDLGSNNTRVYYVQQGVNVLYVFMPSQPYYTYYFTIVDLVGVTNGYFETLRNINGTDRVLERWSLNIVNQVPFIMSWGAAYHLRLTCDQGTYVWGMFVALAEPSQTLVITPGMFPTTYPGLNVTANALRKNSTWIQVNYTDNEALTSWVQITIQYKSGFSWFTAYTQNNTGNTHQLDWYSADEDVDYLARVTALQDDETQTWSFSLLKPALTINPWDPLSSLGDWPVSHESIIGLFLVLAVFGVFSYWRMPLGCVLGVITAAFLTLIGWMDLNWNLIALAGSVAVFAGLAKAKREEREI